MLAKDIVAKQIEVMLGLGRQVLADLTDDELFWTPASSSWRVHRVDGTWTADWVEPEPQDLDPPSLAWQLWHCRWWLSMVADHSFGPGTLTRETFVWDGPHGGFEAVDRLASDVVAEMSSIPDASWHSSDLTRWPYTDGRPFGLVAGWVAMELTKNVAEMARTRAFHRAAQPMQRHGGGAPGS